MREACLRVTGKVCIEGLRGFGCAHVALQAVDIRFTIHRVKPPWIAIKFICRLLNAVSRCH